MNNPYLIEKKKEKRKVLLWQFIVFSLIIIGWELLSRFNIIDSFLFSKPSSIIKLLIDYIKSAEIFKHIFISLLETILGLVIGTFVGIVIAVVLWWNKLLAKVLDPVLIMFNALPKTALAPILIIWAGTGIKGITVVAISISLVLTIISAYSYFMMIEEDQIKMLKSFGANKWQVLFKLVLPANLDNILNIIKINIGMAWVGVIVGEFIVSRAGLGYLIVYGSQVFKMDLVMMGIIVLIIISLLMNFIVNLIYKKIKNKRGIF